MNGSSTSGKSCSPTTRPINVPPNDELDGDYRDHAVHHFSDRERIRQRVNPHQGSQLPRGISEIADMPSHHQCAHYTAVDGDLVHAGANFICYRYRRYQREFSFVGTYQYILRKSRRLFS